MKTDVMMVVTVYNLDHAIDILFYENLEVKFEEEFGKWLEGEKFGDYIERIGVTLEEFVDFFNRNRDNLAERYEIDG